jgi:hypothetical protein
LIHVNIAGPTVGYPRSATCEGTGQTFDLRIAYQKKDTIMKQKLFAPACALASAAAVAAVLGVTPVSAQTQQAPPPGATQQQPSTPSNDPAAMPARGMEHGHQMQNGGHKMMEKEMGKDGEHAGMGGGGAMGKPPCSPGGQASASDQKNAGAATNCK